MSATSEPQVRAAFLQISLRGLERFDAATQQQLRAALPHSVAEVEAARPLRWLSVEHLLRMNDVCRAVVGEGETDAMIEDSMLAAYNGSVWAGFITTATRLFGLSLHGLSRWVPRLYPLVFRNCGALEVEAVDPRAATLRFTQVAPNCIANEHYCRALGSALSVFFPLTQRQGHVRLLVRDTDARTLRYRLEITNPHL